jgi:hypothetical protein
VTGSPIGKEVGESIGEVNRRYSVDDVVTEELRIVTPHPA